MRSRTTHHTDLTPASWPLSLWERVGQRVLSAITDPRDTKPNPLPARGLATLPQGGRGSASRHPRGIALVLVLLAVTVAVILALSFQAAQSTTLPISQNANHHTTARHVAESAVAMAIHHVRSSDTWREDFAAGQLPTDQRFALGTFSVTAEDGQDIDGDGVITQPDEGDGDLADDPSDPVTLTVIGRVGQASHTLKVVVNAFDDPGARLKLLLVVDDKAALSGADKARTAQFEDWNFEVVPISDHAAQGEFDTAVNEADVAYISNSSNAGTLASKLNPAAIGVVSELVAMASPWELATSYGTTPETRLHITDTNHDITEPFTVGTRAMLNTQLDLNRVVAPLAGGGQSLATPAGSLQTGLLAIDAGGTTLGTAAAGRRCLLPFGAGGFHFGHLLADGKTLVYRSLVWASRAPKGPPAVGHWRLDEATGNTAHDSAGSNHGTCFDGTSWTAGRLLNGHDFDGQNDYVQIPDDPVLRPTQKLSICAWVYGDDWSSGDSVDLILRKGEGNPNNWQLSITNGKVALSLDAWDGRNTSGNVYGNTKLDTGKWYHVAATWDGKTAYIYVNGSIDNGSGKSYESTLGTDTRPVYLGGRAGGDAHDRFDGILDDVRLYDRALTGAEIRTIINEATAQDANPVPLPVVKYEFAEVKPDPQLVGHWKLDDPTNDGGGLAANDKIYLLDKGRIDSYRSAQGPYDRTRPGRAAIVATNSTSSNRFHFDNPTSLWGDAFCGVGGNPSSVIDGQNHNISGRKLALGTSVPMTDHSAPSGMPSSQGDRTYSTSRTWSSNQTFANLTLEGSGTFTISGNVRIHCTGSFTLQNSAKLVINPGSSLTLFVGGTATVKDSAQFNPDSTRAGSASIYTYNGDFNLFGSAIAAAVVRSDDDMIIADTAEFYGAAVCRDDLTIKDEAQVHLDLSLPGMGVAQPPAQDDTDTNDGRIFGGADASGDGSGGLIGGLIGGIVNAITSVIGTAIGFDGSDDRIEIQHHDDYLLADGAISLWFKTTHSTRKQGLFSKDSSGYDTGGQTTIWFEGGRVYAKLESTSASYTVQSGSVAANAWHHVVLTFGQGGMKLYINGSLAATNSYTGGLGDPDARTGNFEPILIGASTESSGNQTTTGWNFPLVGFIDDVRLYDYVLDTAQVGNVYRNEPLGPSTLPGYMLHDTGGYGAPLNLSIPDTTKITWLAGGGLQLDQPQVMRSAINADKIQRAVQRHKQITIEARFAPSAAAMGATGTIIGYGSGTSPNLAVHQQSSRWLTQFMAGGSVHTQTAGSTLAEGFSEHVVVTYDGENVSRYRNGVLQETVPLTGDFASWAAANPLSIGGQADGSAPWTGQLQRLVIYDRAFNRTQAKNVFNDQPPGTGAVTGTGAVRYIEMP
mgnify:CR=1 FL=1